MSSNLDKTVMSPEAVARSWLGRLEAIELGKGKPKSAARAAIARRLGVPEGTLENIRRGRTKGVRSWLAERLQAAVISAIEGEIRGLEHDLHIARCTGAVGSIDLSAAEAALENARRALGRPA